MEKIASYVNKGRTIKELIYNAAGEFPQRYAFRFKEDGEIKGRTFYRTHRKYRGIRHGNDPERIR